MMYVVDALEKDIGATDATHSSAMLATVADESSITRFELFSLSD
jgi:hypothetical protein